MRKTEIKLVHDKLVEIIKKEGLETEIEILPDLLHYQLRANPNYCFFDLTRGWLSYKVQTYDRGETLVEKVGIEIKDETGRVDADTIKGHFYVWIEKLKTGPFGM